MKLLIVKTSSMGDVIHALPVLADIQAHCPEAQIDWLVETPFHQIVKLHPRVRNVIPISWRKWRKNLGDAATRSAIASTLRQLRGAHYDVVIDLQGLIKSAAWAKLARGKALHGFDWRSAREPLASVAYHRTHAVNTELLATQRCRQLCAQALGYALPLNSDFGIAAPALQASDWLAEHAAANPSQSPSPYWACVHGSSDDARLWPAQDWLKLAQFAHGKGLAVVLIWGSEAERERSEQLRSAMQAAGVNATVPPFLTIAQTAQVLASARCVVGLDTGFTHLAGALGKPTVSLHRTHDPALTGVKGAATCIALGGKGQTPPYAAVESAFERLLNP